MIAACSTRCAAALLFAVIAPCLAGCDCGESNTTTVSSELKAKLLGHPCGQVDPDNAPTYATLPIGTSGAPAGLRVPGAFPGANSEFYIIKDAQGINRAHGDLPVQPENTPNLDIDLSAALPPGTYTVDVLNSTTGNCNSMDIGTSAPFTVK